MNRTILWCAAAALLLASCRAEDSEARGATQLAAADTSSLLTAQGWGPLHIGMTRAEVVAAAGEDAHPELVGGPDPAQCDEFRPDRAPQGMRVMIERGRLTRISLSAGSEVKTEDGFGIGDSASAITAAYGARVEISPHQYLAAPAEYITVWSSDPPDGHPRGVVYEIGVDGRVAHIHAGGPSIQYVEGCV